MLNNSFGIKFFRTSVLFCIPKLVQLCRAAFSSTNPVLTKGQILLPGNYVLVEIF